MTDYPVRLQAQPDPAVSRWLWLVKWLLAIPHYILLFFLWIGFSVLTLVAFFAVLFTGRYPRALFDFNVGVLRWTWRVGFYAYSALGTDRYPPFTLDDVPDYPARLQVEYPEQLSHGLVLVKWLLAIPHLLVIAILLGGGPYLTTRVNDTAAMIQGGGLLGLLVLIAAVALLFTTRYPRDLFNLIVGFNRWVYRVAGYFFLMTDKYPPFRLDQGPGDEPETPEAESLPTATTATTTYPVTAAASEPPVAELEPQRRSWTAGRVIGVVAGSLLLLLGIGLVPAGGVALWYDQTARDSGGFVNTDAHRFNTVGYAISSEPGALTYDGPDWVMERVIGDVRVTATNDNAKPVFLGIASTSDAESYLTGVQHSVVTQLDSAPVQASYRMRLGLAPRTQPGSETFWIERAEGPGQQVVTWQPRAGNWSVVVMNADGSRVVAADLTVGATLPWLDDLAFWLIGLGLLTLLGGALLISLAVRRPQRKPEPVPVS
ncbi:uncharacterized protein DUF4389 [Kribbella amoyensis]|uniref:Uncharacterized protein DUF4389 n=1 Tax=Kribbella amoyensis TaxID=996641 RepID=A0A561BSG5_9ACTN|nr:DUF4389 domain-containing protein [Kribbella amoyensis]TWD81759.1 uncharacterized protein DUF4389 [Kribbella amoyensis]